MRYLGKMIRWIPDTFPLNYSRKYLRLRSAVRSGTTDEGSGFRRLEAGGTQFLN